MTRTLPDHTMDALQRTLPPLPFNEAERLRALLDSCILGTPPDAAFDALAQTASVLMQAPIAAVSLLDQHRQWFKSSVGVPMTSTSREDAFCAYAILQREPLVVLDASRDARFAANPFVTATPGVRFYVGIPVRSDDGFPIGTLCVADSIPRDHVDARSLKMLSDLAETVEALIRSHRIAQYVDRATNLPNALRFHENAASLRQAALLMEAGDNAEDFGQDRSPQRETLRRLLGRVGAVQPPAPDFWAVSVEALSAARADNWLAQGKPERIDQQLEAMATWLRSAVETRDGVYRLSARHLAFFVAMPRPAVSRMVVALARQLGMIDPERDARFEQGIADMDSALNVRAGEVQVVAMRVGESADVASLVTALIAQGNGAGAAAAYDPARHGCQMRVNLCAALAEGFDVTIPDVALDSVAALHGAGLREDAWRADGHRRPAAMDGAGTTVMMLDMAQRHALLDWFSRWWTMERRPSARLQLRGGSALLAQSPQQWLDALLHVGLLPAQLEIAVPLPVLRERLSETQRRVRAWREAGIGVVVTGFGAGFDTVRWLPTLPLTGVSFDPRVVEAVRKTPKHARVVQRLVSLAHALGMRVSADGLQSETDLRTARGLGIDEGSGDAAAQVLSIQDGGTSGKGVRGTVPDPSAPGVDGARTARIADGSGDAPSIRWRVHTRRKDDSGRGDLPGEDISVTGSRAGRHADKPVYPQTIVGARGAATTPMARRAAPVLRIAGADPSLSDCPHGDGCNAGCIPPRTATRDSIMRASQYPRFRFQS